MSGHEQALELAADALKDLKPRRPTFTEQAQAGVTAYAAAPGGEEINADLLEALEQFLAETKAALNFLDTNVADSWEDQPVVIKARAAVLAARARGTAPRIVSF